MEETYELIMERFDPEKMYWAYKLISPSGKVFEQLYRPIDVDFMKFAIGNDTPKINMDKIPEKDRNKLNEILKDVKIN